MSEPIGVGDHIICIGGSVLNVIGKVNKIIPPSSWCPEIILEITIVYAPPDNYWEAGGQTHVYQNITQRYMP